MDEEEEARWRFFAEDWIPNLSVAIVREAVICSKAAQKFRDGNEEIAKVVADDSDRFFKSWWYKLLTSDAKSETRKRLENAALSEMSEDIRKEVTLGYLKSACKDIVGDEKFKALKYYDKRVNPQLEDILKDLRSEMCPSVARGQHQITAYRWEKCREYVPGFKEKTDEAMEAGGKARQALGDGYKDGIMRTLEDNRCEIEKSIGKGVARAAIARDLGVSIYWLDKFLAAGDAAEGAQKMTAKETEKFLSSKLPYIRSRLAAGVTRTAISKNLGVSFYKLKTFLDAENARAAENGKACAPSPAEEACEDERATRAKLDAKRRKDKEKIIEGLRTENEDLPEGVAAQRPRDGVDGSNGDGDETGKGDKEH